MPTKTDFINAIQLNDRVIKGRSEGVTHETSVKQLPFPGNCFNWNLGHILVYRASILGAIDGESEMDEAEGKMYAFGSEPLTDGDAAIPLDTLHTRLDEISAQIQAALEAMPDSHLETVLDEERGVTVEGRLSFYLMFHEAYHIGQLEILQELAKID